MSKGNSGLFHGTLGTTRGNSTQERISYSDRGIEIPFHIKEALSALKKKGDILTASLGSFSMKDISIMSKETGVEFAYITIGETEYLIRGDIDSTEIPLYLEKKMIKYGGVLKFHSHPHNDDLIPSVADREIMKRLRNTTGQQYSTIVTPNGRTVSFNENGVMETGTVHNLIDEDLKSLYYKMFGGE